MILPQLFRAFAYGSIQHAGLRTIRTIVPAVTTIFLLVIYMLLPVSPRIIGDKALLDYLLQVVGILPGFYIAALAAAATFPNDMLDEPMLGQDAPKMSIIRGGQTFPEVAITTRMFVANMFSYLSAWSFLTAIIILGTIELYPSLEHLLKDAKSGGFAELLLILTQYAVVCTIVFLFMRTVLVTLHGLYFLAERMHQGNR